MRKGTILAAIAALALPAAPAMAQGIPVHDSSSLIQQIRQVQQAIQMIEQGRQQIEQAQELRRELNGLTDIPALVERFGEDALRQLGVGEASLRNIGNGEFEFVGSARTRVDQAYDKLLASLGGNASDAGDRTARMIASQVGVAETVGSSVETRREQIAQLSERLSTAETAKEVADLQAAISAQSLALQNDMMALQAIELERRAADAVRAQNAVNTRIQGIRERREALERALNR